MCHCLQYPQQHLCPFYFYQITCLPSFVKWSRTPKESLPSFLFSLSHLMSSYLYQSFSLLSTAVQPPCGESPIISQHHQSHLLPHPPFYPPPTSPRPELLQPPPFEPWLLSPWQRLFPSSLWWTTVSSISHHNIKAILWPCCLTCYWCVLLPKPSWNSPWPCFLGTLLALTTFLMTLASSPLFYFFLKPPTHKLYSISVLRNFPLFCVNFLRELAPTNRTSVTALGLALESISDSGLCLWSSPLFPVVYWASPSGLLFGNASPWCPSLNSLPFPKTLSYSVNPTSVPINKSGSFGTPSPVCPWGSTGSLSLQSRHLAQGLIQSNDVKYIYEWSFVLIWSAIKS